MPNPGEHKVIPWCDHGTARLEGWSLRDTILIVGPVWQAWAIMRWPSKGMATDNVLKHACGGVHIDVCRVRHANPADFAHHNEMVERLKAKGGNMARSWKNSSDLSGSNDVSLAGRWPPNVLLVHSPGCRIAGMQQVRGNAPQERPMKGSNGLDYGAYNTTQMAVYGFGDANGMETIDAWNCEPGCLVAALDGLIFDLDTAPMGNSKDYMPLTSGTESRPPERQFASCNDAVGVSRFFPQFESLDGAMAWIAKLVGGVDVNHAKSGSAR